jgi:hypothetical protein
MSGTYSGNKKDSNDKVLYGPTDTEDNNTSITSTEKSHCCKRPATESDSASTLSQTKKTVFISENIGQSKSTEDKTTDAYTSSSTTVKHWRKNFQPRVSNQPITLVLKKSGYRLNKPNYLNKEEPETKAKAKYSQLEEYYSDSDCGVINYISDYNTPTGLVDHNYIWQAKQQELEEIISKGSATA